MHVDWSSFLNGARQLHQEVPLRPSTYFSKILRTFAYTLAVQDKNHQSLVFEKVQSSQDHGDLPDPTWHWGPSLRIDLRHPGSDNRDLFAHPVAGRPLVEIWSAVSPSGDRVSIFFPDGAYIKGDIVEVTTLTPENPRLDADAFHCLLQYVSDNLRYAAPSRTGFCPRHWCAPFCPAICSIGDAW